VARSELVAYADYLLYGPTPTNVVAEELTTRLHH
jgi:hypothetical protein